MRQMVLLLCLFLTSQTAIADPVISTDMTFDEITEHLNSHGASRLRGAYHLPWSSYEGTDMENIEWDKVRRGYHAYFHLDDWTCLSITVESYPDKGAVWGFELGMPGERYTGKFEWYEAGDAGLHTFPQVINLSEHKAPFPWLRYAMILVCLVFVISWIYEKWRRFSLKSTRMESA